MIKLRPQISTHACRNHEFVDGVAIVNGYSGSNDFTGLPQGTNVVTVSVDPRIWKLIHVYKCKICGFSLSAGTKANYSET